MNLRVSNAFMKLTVTIVIGIILLVNGNGCVHQRRVDFVGLKNGTILQGEVKLPIEVRVGDLDGIFMIANGGPIPDGVQIRTNSAGHWFADWDTQNVPNGIYDIYLEADSGDKSFLSTTKSITVSNMICLDSLPIFGTRTWVLARLAVPHADWTVKVFNSKDRYIGYFAGTTTNGFINFVWDLEDKNGKKYTNENSFRFDYTITPLDNLKPAVPHEHPNLQAPSYPLTDKEPHKLIPAD